MNEETLRVNIGHGYGGAIKIEALVDGMKYIIEREYLIALLEEMILEKGYKTYKNKHQIIPRLEINS